MPWPLHGPRLDIHTKGYAAPSIDVGHFGLASLAATSAAGTAQAASVAVSKPSLAVEVFRCADDAFGAAIESAAADAFTADYVARAAHAAFWNAVSADATQVEGGAATSAIARSPLWPEGQPDKLQRLWQEMKATLHAAEQDWQVWTSWYDDRLAGNGDEEREFAYVRYVRIENALWNQGPAIVNAEIKRRIDEQISYGDLHAIGDSDIAKFEGVVSMAVAEPKPRRPRKKEPKPSPVPEIPPTLPAPIENVPSAVSFGWTLDGTITIVAGAQNWPVLPFKGSEQDHANRLEACRVLATDTARSLRSGEWNIRPDYAETLDQYVAYIPKQPEEGNFLLADAKARIIRSMFAAEQDFLPVPVAAELKVLLEQHIGLRAYYPATEEFYEFGAIGPFGTAAADRRRRRIYSRRAGQYTYLLRAESRRYDARRRATFAADFKGRCRI